VVEPRQAPEEGDQGPSTQAREAIDLATLGALLTDHADDAAAAIGLSCRIAGRRFVLPARTVFADFWFRTGQPYSTKRHGKPEICTPGILQFTLYAPEAFDHSRTIVIANHLKDAFGEKTWTVGSDTWVVIERMQVQTPRGFHYGRSITVVDGGFDFYRPNELSRRT
jgi:hypothetical protein